MKKTFNRREVIKTVTFAAGTLFISNVAGAAFLFKDEQTADRVSRELRSFLKGEVSDSRLRLRGLSTDFGGLIRKEPRIIVYPADEQDLRLTMQIAREMQVPVSFRGTGHSCFGQSLSDGGILLLNSPGGEKGITIKDGVVEVATGVMWSEVEADLNEKGLTSPVLTDYLDLSVGGTLSVGGYGLRSFQFGGQVDYVESLTLILPDGTKKTCSEDENPDLFRFSLCGLGQLGLITSVKYKTIPYREKTVVYYLYCPSVERFFSTLKDLFLEGFIEGFDHFSGYWIHGSYVVEVGKSFFPDQGPDHTRLKNKLSKSFPGLKEKFINHYHQHIHRARNEWVERYRNSYCLWEDYAFDLAGLKEFLSRNIAGGSFRNRSILPAVYFLAMNSGRSRNIPFSLTAGRRGEMLFGAGFYHMVPYGRDAELLTAKDQLKKNMADCLELGGRPYLYGWHDLAEEQKRHLYGDDFLELKKLKQKYDPPNIVNPHVFLL